MRFAIVVSSYHAFVTERLTDGARAVLRDAGIPDGDVAVFPVPGSYELAQAAGVLAASGAWSAVICLGCLIRGETPHFQIIADAAADGIMRAAQSSGVPMAFGVLTTNSLEEAVARAGDNDMNKGREAAAAALDMAKLYERLRAAN
jgi:6,7-dimethyl-8-ribityllumazine synthase